MLSSSTNQPSFYSASLELFTRELLRNLRFRLGLRTGITSTGKVLASEFNHTKPHIMSDNQYTLFSVEPLGCGSKMLPLRKQIFYKFSLKINLEHSSDLFHRILNCNPFVYTT